MSIVFSLHYTTFRFHWMYRYALTQVTQTSSTYIFTNRHHGHIGYPVRCHLCWVQLSKAMTGQWSNTQSFSQYHHFTMLKQYVTIWLYDADSLDCDPIGHRSWHSRRIEACIVHSLGTGHDCAMGPRFQTHTEHACNVSGRAGNWWNVLVFFAWIFGISSHTYVVDFFSMVFCR